LNAGPRVLKSFGLPAGAALGDSGSNEKLHPGALCSPEVVRFLGKRSCTIHELRANTKVTKVTRGKAKAFSHESTRMSTNKNQDRGDIFGFLFSFFPLMLKNLPGLREFQRIHAPPIRVIRVNSWLNGF
jgi:hypothetical protein